jgi:hypothetical protein
MSCCLDIQKQFLGVVLHAVPDANVGCLMVNTGSSTETVICNITNISTMMTAVRLADMMLTQSCSQQIHWHIYVAVNDGKACSAFFFFNFKV